MDPVVLTVCILLAGLLAWVGLGLWLRSRKRRRSIATAPSAKSALEWVNLGLGILAGLAAPVVYFLGGQPLLVAAVLLVAALLVVRWINTIRSDTPRAAWQLDGNIAFLVGPEAAQAQQSKLFDPVAATEVEDVFALLRWQGRLVPELVGRDEDLDRLLRWAREGRGIGVRLLSGPGGVGKSRLAAELCEVLRAEGWTADFARLGSSGDDTPASILLPAARKGTLIVLDYPEENRKRVRRILRSLEGLKTHGHPLRLLLLSRYGIEAWQDDLDDAGGRVAPPLDVPPIPLPAGYDLFCEARRRLAQAAGPPEPPSREAFEEWQRRSEVHLRPLLVLAAAVDSMERKEGWSVYLTARDVMTALVRRELRRLRRESEGREGWNQETLPRLLALAALAGGLPAQRLRELAERSDELELHAGPPAELIDKLSGTGRLNTDKTTRVLPAPSPDLLAAALAWEVLQASPGLAPERLWAAVEGDVDNGFKRLERVIYDAEVTLGLRNPRLGDWLEQAFEGQPGRCDAVMEAFTDVNLPAGLARVAEAVWGNALAGELDDVARARIMFYRSAHLHAIGDRKGALAAIHESVEIQRGLASENPERHRAGLAHSLGNLSNQLAAVGDRDTALAEIRECVAIFKKLTEREPERYEPELALNLNNLSNRLADTGHTAAALNTIQQAVVIRRRLARDNPQRFDPDLALSLNNLSVCVVDTGDCAAALEAIHEAVDIYRRLARDNPQRFDPDLALSLNNLSNRLADIGDTAAALDAIQRAVDIQRRLATDNPQRFESDLAQSLNDLCVHLAETGDTAAALDAIQEAVSIRRRLARDNRQRFEADLAESLHNLSLRLAETGDTAAALDAIHEAVDIRRRFAQDNPQRFEPYLACSLWVEASHLRENRNPAAALRNLQEAIPLIALYAHRYPNSVHGRWHQGMLHLRKELTRNGED